MVLLLAGLIIFFGTHGFTAMRSARASLIARLGEGPYKGLYSLLSLAGFVLIVVGMGKIDPVRLWTPPEWGPRAALWLMPLAFIALAGAYIPGNLKRITAHPMLWGVTLWAMLHLLANGDLAGLLLFGSFGLYSVYAMWSQTQRGSRTSTTRRPILNDVTVVIAGLAAYGVTLHYHAQLFGVPALW